MAPSELAVPARSRLCRESRSHPRPVRRRLGGGTVVATEDYVLSADEKTSIQARRRRHASVPPAPAHIAKIEHEYERLGAWAYLTARDVRRAKLFGRCEPATGIAPFDRLVAQVMAEEPYRSARRVFWILDNGSGHRGPKAVERLQRQWPTVIPVFTPIHASWLNQIEIYFSVVQRKVLTPGDFVDLAALEAALLGFQHRYEHAARPFEWTFTRQDLAVLLAKLALAEQRPAAPGPPSSSTSTVESQNVAIVTNATVPTIG